MVFGTAHSSVLDLLGFQCSIGITSICPLLKWSEIMVYLQSILSSNTCNIFCPSVTARTSLAYPSICIRIPTLPNRSENLAPFATGN